MQTQQGEDSHQSPTFTAGRHGSQRQVLQDASITHSNLRRSSGNDGTHILLVEASDSGSYQSNASGETRTATWTTTPQGVAGLHFSSRDDTSSHAYSWKHAGGEQHFSEQERQTNYSTNNANAEYDNALDGGDDDDDDDRADTMSDRQHFGDRSSPHGPHPPLSKSERKMAAATRCKLTRKSQPCRCRCGKSTVKTVA